MNTALKVWKIGLPISLSKLVALSLPVVDAMMLGRYDSGELSTLAVANIIPQLVLVVSIGLLSGVNILSSRKDTQLQRFSGSVIVYTLSISLALVSVGFLIGSFFTDKNESQVQSVILFGIPFVIVYIGITGILESNEFQRFVIAIGCFAMIVNVGLNLVFLSFLDDSSEGAAEAISLSTTIVRLLVLVASIFVLKKKVGIVLNFQATKNGVLSLWSLGATTSVSSLIFTLTISALIYFVKINGSSNDVALFSISMNFVGLSFVTFLGLSIAIGIVISKEQGHRYRENTTALVATVLMPPVFFYLILMVALKGEISAMYFGYNSPLMPLFEVLVLYCSLIVAVDAVLTGLISAQRAVGDKVVPPILRVAFFSISSLVFSTYFFLGYGVEAVLLSMAIGNILGLAAVLFRMHYATGVRETSNVRRFFG